MPQLLPRASSRACAPSPSTREARQPRLQADSCPRAAPSWPRTEAVPPMRARCSSGRAGTSSWYHWAIGASSHVGRQLQVLLREAAGPAAAQLAGAVAGAWRARCRRANRRRAARSAPGAAPSAACRPARAPPRCRARRSASSRLAWPQPKRTGPKRVSMEWPASCGANQEAVTRRSTVGTPTSKPIGPSCTRCDHSPVAGASTSLTISTTAMTAVTIKAASMYSTKRKAFFTRIPGGLLSPECGPSPAAAAWRARCRRRGFFCAMPLVGERARQNG